MPPRVQRPAPPVFLILTTVAVGLLVTALVSLARVTTTLGDGRHRIGVLTVDDLHEGQLEISAAMVLALTAAVLWGRVRRLPTRRHLMLFLALCLLALDNLVSGLLTGGFDSLSANRFATWSSAINGLIAVTVLVWAVWLPDEPLRSPRTAIPRALLAACGLITIAMLAVWQLRDVLPGAFTTRPESARDVTFLSDHPSLYVIEALTAVGWAIATLLFTQLARRSQDDLTAWLALASALSTVSSVNYALFPSHFTELLYLGDYFFLLAVLAFLIGSIREVGVAEAALVDRALYDERRRIAREMHDGVAQELAIMSNQTYRIRAHPETADVGLRRIQESVDRAMDEARTAIKHLSGPVSESLASEIATDAGIITGRAGARLVLDLDDTVTMPARVRLELAHVTREAVAEAVRGRGARTIQIDLHGSGSTVLRISDDARAQSAADTSGTSTTTSIRERVERLGGQLLILPRDGGGTTVEVTVP